MTNIKTTEPTLSRHAVTRMQQRGIRRSAAALVLRHGDRAKPVGGGVVALSLSRAGADELQEAGLAPAAICERLPRLTVLVHEEASTVLTVCWRYGRKARAYEIDTKRY